MAAIAQAVVDELAGSVDDLLSQAAAVVTGTQADYIANGEPSSVYGKLQQAGARQACRRYADDPSPFQGRASVLAENACRPYLDSIGYGQPPQIETPFSGGQCSVRYRLQTEFRRFNSNLGEWEWRAGFLFEYNGPLTVTATPGQGTCSPGQVGPVSHTLTSPNESQARSLATGCADQQPSWRWLVIERLDGQPDTCGSPPPEVVPPVPPAVPGPPRERFNPGPGIDVEIGVSIDPDGTINVDFGTGDISIDPFGGGGDGGGGGGTAPPAPGEPGPSEETGPGGEASGEAPEGAELVGVLVEVLSSPVNANRFGNNSLEPFRGVAYVRMGYPGRLGVDMSGSAVVPPQFFHAQQRGLTAWSVSANIGFSLRTTPYYRTPPE